jgi:group I intron endonuclease
MFLYVIRNTKTGMEYVGITVRSLSARMVNHRSACFKRLEDRPLYNAMRADGIEHFHIEAIAETDSYEELEALEKAAIAERNTLYPHGYNAVRGGRGSFGYRHTEHAKAAMSAGHRGLKTWLTGKTMSPEHRTKCSIGQRKRVETEQANGFVRKAWNKGVPWTAAHRANATRNRTAWNKGLRTGPGTGRKHSPETCAKIAALKQSKKLSPEIVARRAEQKLYQDAT